MLRALRRRCPDCGTPVFETYFRMRAVCRRCRLLTDRGEPDYFLGAMLVNLMAAEGAAAALVLLGLLLTWPAVPWDPLLWTGLGLAVCAPVGFYPFSSVLWLAVDLRFRPPVRADEAAVPEA